LSPPLRKVGFVPCPTARPNNTDWLKQTAKYIEPLKTNEKYPIEVLIRGKDAEENKKIFDKLADTIKTAGVS